MTFATELALYGPDPDTGIGVDTDSAATSPSRPLSQHAVPMTTRQAIDYCRRLAVSHYENFTVVSWLLPKKLRTAFAVFYSYCRWSDDLADEVVDSELALRLLQWWENGVHRCFDRGDFGTSGCDKKDTISEKHPVLIALREIAGEFSLSKQPFLDLLRAFRQDQVKKRYETMSELLEYCRYSANPVGRTILELAGCPRNKTDSDTDSSLWQYSDSICTGLQLANFWQDVARDWQNGRLYIPMEVCRQFDVPIPDVGAVFSTPPDGTHHHNWTKMMKYLVSDARSRLLAGTPLLSKVPQTIRFDITLFQRGGLAILDAIERQKYDVLRHRPVISRWKKFQLCLPFLWRWFLF